MISNHAKRFGGIASLLLLVSASAWADSGVGVDTWRANKLDPTGGRHRSCATRMARAGSRRSSIDRPRAISTTARRSRRSCADSATGCITGCCELGYVNTGDDRFALWNRYTDWKANQAVGSIDLHFERPSDGTYAEVRGSRINDDDQYYQAVYGQAGAYKVQAFIRDMPNILSTDARPIWNGVGSNMLTLPRSLTPGESTSAQVAAVSAATPVQTLGVTRKKEGLNLSGYFTPHWTGYLDVTHERREGIAPYGGPFGEDWPGPIPGPFSKQSSPSMMPPST